jgi:hypothetical protein
MLINLTADPDAIPAATPALESFVSRMPAAPVVHADAPAAGPSGAAVFDADQLLPRVDEAFAITTQVRRG